MSLTEQDLSQLEQLYFEGRFSELESRGILLTAKYPHIGLVWSILGTALAAQGKSALHAHSRAAELLPQDPQAQLQYGDALFAGGQMEAAIAAYRGTIALQPDWAAAHNNLGNALKAQGLLADAHHRYTQALQCDPRFALAHYNLAMLNRDVKNYDDVEPGLRQVLQIDPSFSPAWVELASVLKDKGDVSGAEQALAQAIELSPQLLEAHLNIATMLLLRGNAIGAEQRLRIALQLDPTSARAHLQLGMALQGQGRTVEARAQIGRALSLRDDLVECYKVLADIACEEGDIGSANHLLMQAIGHDPSDVPARSRSLFFKSQSVDISPEGLFADHTAFGQLLQSKYLFDRLPPAHSAYQPKRKLKVGFVSGDFNNHIVARSLLPVLAHLSKYELELFAYSNNHVEDEWTSLLKRHFSNWKSVLGMAVLSLAQCIRADGIDILIDLSGHTPLNCLEAFALKPAPLQVSWLGYTSTTGVSEVDYYFADVHWLPPGQFDHLFVEKLVYLPAFLPFQFHGRFPEVNDAPRSADAPFTFATFNHPRKLSSDVLGAWASILSGTTDTRLVLGGIDDIAYRNRIAASFASAGIEPNRLLFYPRRQPYDYLKLHQMVDLCLDAFPYPSATTIQHALWMGVPTLTLAGKTPVARAGAAIMEHVGLTEYIATAPGSYIERAISAANQSTANAPLRSEIRQKFLGSALCQPVDIARGLHAALQMMWARHNQGYPIQSFAALTK